MSGLKSFRYRPALKIKTPFKEWAAAQIKAGKPFKPFFGTLADGKLGKNYTLTPELEAELVAQPAPKPIKPVVRPGKRKKKPTQAAPRDEMPFSVLAYNETILGRTLTDRQARKDGITLANIARIWKLEPGRAEHPVWKQVNTYPRYFLDRFYTKSLAKKANEPGSGNAFSDALPPTRFESTLARNEAGAGSENISQG